MNAERITELEEETSNLHTTVFDMGMENGNLGAQILTLVIKFRELETKLRRAEAILSDKLPELEWCDTCLEYTETGVHTINGRVGGFDHWLPDEHVGYCPQCEKEQG